MAVAIQPNQLEGRIFVTKLPFEVSSEDLKAYFEKFGEVTDAYVPKNPQSKMNKGFGFVSFLDPATVQKVMDEPNHSIKGRIVVVDKASARSQKPFLTPEHWNNPNAMFYANMYYPPNPYQYQQPRPTFCEQQFWMQPPWVGQSRSTVPQEGVSNYGTLPKAHVAGSPVKVFVGRISYDSTAETLEKYFKQFGTVTDAYIPKDRITGKSRGFGFVTFANEEALTKCFLQQEHFIDGRQVALDYADPNKPVDSLALLSGLNSLSASSALAYKPEMDVLHY